MIQAKLKSLGLFHYHKTKYIVNLKLKPKENLAESLVTLQFLKTVVTKTCKTKQTLAWGKDPLLTSLIHLNRLSFLYNFHHDGKSAPWWQVRGQNPWPAVCCGSQGEEQPSDKGMQSVQAITSGANSKRAIWNFKTCTQHHAYIDSK